MSTGAVDNDPLNVVLLALVKQMEQGQTPERKSILAAHPKFADELEEFFASRDCLARLTTGLSAERQRPGLMADLRALADFRLVREIGRGGMGVVYEAVQISLNRLVALKVLPLAAALDARHLQRFKNEAQAAALMHHPRIVPIYSVGCEEGIHYYAMRLIEGESLAQMIRRLRPPLAGPEPTPPTTTDVGGPVQKTDQSSPGQAMPRSTAREESAKATVPAPLPSASTATRASASAPRHDHAHRAARFVMEAAEALEHAHQLGVVHRDIKPANLLVDTAANLWITDFGVALLQPSAGVTATGELVGTLRYMSPEQAAAKRGHVDHRTDIYSLGATFYELLTLEPAFPSNDAAILLQQITRDEPRPPRALVPSLPAELDIIVLKAMAKSPAERYASAQELADDLARFLEDKPIWARRPTWLDRSIKWSRRHRAMVLSSLVVLVIVTLGLLVSTVMVSRLHREAADAYESEKLKAAELNQERLRAEKNLAHARQVVAYLTQVSAQDISDQPEFLPVRQKLLTAALQYYQQFIDEHEGDPTIRAELDASRAQVDHILTVLTAQREYTRLMLRALLVGEIAVQKDLRITSEQKEKLLDFALRVKEQNQQAFQVGLKLSEQERGKQFIDLAAANEKLLTSILNPEQIARLKQIAVQQQGIHAFADAEVAATLALSGEQKLRMRTALDEATLGRRNIYASVRDPGDADHDANDLTERTGKNILGMLTPAQQEAWRQMTGEPFRSRMGFMPNDSFEFPDRAGPWPPPPDDRAGTFGERGPPGPPPGGWRGKKDGPPPDDGPFPLKKKKN